MENGDKHKRVHFRRRDIRSLSHFPSASEQHPKLHRRPHGVRLARAAGYCAAVLCALVVLAAGTVWIGANSEYGRAWMEQVADTAIRKAAGDKYSVTLGGKGLSFSAFDLLGLEFNDIELNRSGDAVPVVKASLVRFGLRPLPLLSREVRLDTMRVSDVEIRVPDETGETSDPLASIRNGNGLVDPDRIVTVIFSAMREMATQVSASEVQSVIVDKLKLFLPDSEIDVASARLTAHSPGQISISAELTVGSQTLTLEGGSVLDGNGNVADLNLTVSVPDVATTEGRIPHFRARKLTVDVTGSEAGGAAMLRAQIRARGLQVTLDEDGPSGGDLDLVAELGEGTGKVELASGKLRLNQSSFAFSGAVGPRPATGNANDPPAYRWELVSNEARLAALDANERSVAVHGRLAGTYEPEDRRLSADTIGIRTNGGEVLGSAKLVFGETAPAVFLALRVPELPVSHAKQIWPWFAAKGARRWVVDNVFDGVIENSKLELSVVADRLGNGVPLGPEEITGHFVINNTRFDITGDIPAVREADGVVDLKGTDVDISLSKGIAFMAGGLSVAVSDGTMRIRDAHEKPVFGDMEIDIRGDAPSIVELASNDPINAAQRLDLKPDEVSGSVEGRVKVQVPLDRDARAIDVGWSVDLTFDNLSLTKEFEGQKLTDASGTLKADNSHVTFDADGKLNGVPSTVVLAEPLGEGGPAASRKVTMKLDDAARRIIAPGLDIVLAGVAEVTIDLPTGEGADAKPLLIDADLTRSELKIPWFGWKKGTGIAAKAAFKMNASATTISDLVVSGKSFSLKGDLSFAGGEVSKANFPAVKLNPGDSFSVAATRRNGGYAVDVSGKSIDARSLIKLLRGGLEEEVGTDDDEPVSVKARVDRVRGFSDESLTGLRLEATAIGSTPTSIELTATTASGAAASVTYSDKRGARRLRAETGNAGAVLRFSDTYERIQGGKLTASLDGAPKAPLSGVVEMTDFAIAGEPRLATLVSTPPPESNGRSLAETIRRDIDVSSAKFDLARVTVTRNAKRTTLREGVMRGPTIGTTFQGTIANNDDDISITGTFMPAYGINRIFGEIPVLGQILGNGRNGGLIGITYKLTGTMEDPNLSFNPISAVAPGIFRTIFEYR